MAGEERFHEGNAEQTFSSALQSNAKAPEIVFRPLKDCSSEEHVSSSSSLEKNWIVYFVAPHTKGNVLPL